MKKHIYIYVCVFTIYNINLIPPPRSCILVATPGFIFDAHNVSPSTLYRSSTQGSLELYQWTVDVPRIRNLVYIPY